MDDLLHTFSTSKLPSQQTLALRELAQTKALAQVAKGAEFEAGLRSLREGLLHDSSEERLWALAALGRVWSSVKQQRGSVEALLGQADSMPEPSPLQSLPESDERAYAATALAWLSAAWSPLFLARAIVHEEAGENAREECARSALVLTRDLTTVLGLMREELAKLGFDTEKPADSMGRRVRRVLTALHKTLGERRVSAESSGKALGALLYDAFRRTGAPGPLALRKELVEATAGVVHDVVRARFAQATQPSTYDALDVVSRWFRPHEWSEVAPSMESVREIGEDLVEAIALLAKAGVADDRMKAQLRVAMGTEAAAGRLTALGTSLTGLTDEMRDWLSGTRPPLVLDSVEEAGARGIEQIVAAAIVRDGTSTQGAEALEALKQIATLRGLEMNYSIGDIVEFSALDHQLVGGTLGVRLVSIVEPQVRAKDATGRFRVVRKALVQPAPVQE